MKEHKIINLRAFAITLVVLGHSIIIYDPTWAILGTEVQRPLLIYLKGIINFIQMPIFFSISGYCFYFSIHNRKATNIGDFIKRKTLRILVPYVIICLFYMDPIKYFLHVPGFILSPLTFVRQILLFKDNGHLWFLCTLFLLLIVNRFLLAKFRGNIVFSLSLLMFSIMLSVVSYRLPSEFSIKYFAQYDIYFLIVFFIRYFKSCLDKIIGNQSLWLRLCLSLSIFFILVYLVTKQVNLHRLDVFVSAVTVFLMYILMANKTCSVIEYISDNSYGLYLFHSPLIYFMFTYYPNVSPWLMLFVNFIVCPSIIFILISLIRRTQARVIIGE